jgi:uncharacterized protein (DUF486 family)
MEGDAATIDSWFSKIGVTSYYVPFILILIATVFQIFAWYSHINLPDEFSMLQLIMISWLIAFFEFVFLIPSFNLADKAGTDLAFISVYKEALFFVLFAIFNWLVLGNAITMKQLIAYGLMGIAVYVAA